MQEASSCVYHVIEWSRRSGIVRDLALEERRYFLYPFPSLHQYHHEAVVEETVYLYRLDDKPMLRALGFYRNASMVVSH